MHQHSGKEARYIMWDSAIEHLFLSFYKNYITIRAKNQPQKEHLFYSFFLQINKPSVQPTQRAKADIPARCRYDIKRALILYHFRHLL